MADRTRWPATVRTRTTLASGIVVAVALVVAGEVLLATLLSSIKDAIPDHDRLGGVITVDDGPGIPLRDRVFERFVRLDEAGTAEEGTGLGLAIVHDTVTSYHGEADVTDAPLGGARLTITLPSATDG